MTVTKKNPLGRIMLVACSATKAKEPCEAQKMYTSPLFRKSLAYAVSIAPWDTWIVSAEHGLLPLDRVIAPYNRTLAGMGKSWARFWGIRVAEDLQMRYIGVLQLVILGGEDYCAPIRGGAHLRGWPAPIEPLHGMQIGERLRWLTAHAPTTIETNDPGEPNPTIPRTLTPSKSVPYFQPTEPYISQYQSPLGWVVSLYDPKVSTTAPIETIRPLKKLTHIEKHRLIQIYKYKKENRDG